MSDLINRASVRLVSENRFPKGMSKNKYTPHESKWTLTEWREYCPNMEYRVKRQNDFPEFLPESLTSKFNCGMVAASGNDRTQTFVFQGYRIDNDEIDEHQYIVSFNIEKGTTHAGFVDHADYSGRTTEIPAEMLESLSLSGVSANCQFERMPPNEAGSLADLVSGGLISGFVNSIEVQNTME